MPNDQAYTFVMPPKPVGCWQLGHNGSVCTQFPIFKKPTDEQIKNTEELLGWKWMNINE